MAVNKIRLAEIKLEVAKLEAELESLDPYGDLAKTMEYEVNEMMNLHSPRVQKAFDDCINSIKRRKEVMDKLIDLNAELAKMDIINRTETSLQRIEALMNFHNSLNDSETEIVDGKIKIKDNTKVKQCLDKLLEQMLMMDKEKD